MNSERFKVERIFIASEWLKKRLAYRKRDEIRREYVENKKTIPPFSQSGLDNLFERFVIGMWSISTEDQYNELYIKNASGDIIGRCGTIPVGVMYKTPSDLITLIKDKVKKVSDYGSDYTHILLPSIEQYPALDFVVFDYKEKKESSNQKSIIYKKEITLTLIQTTINAAKKVKDNLLEFNELFNMKDITKIELILITDNDIKLDITKVWPKDKSKFAKWIPISRVEKINTN